MESLWSGRCYSIPEVIYCLYKTVRMQINMLTIMLFHKFNDTLTIIDASVFHPNILIFTPDIFWMPLASCVSSTNDCWLLILWILWKVDEKLRNANFIKNHGMNKKLHEKKVFFKSSKKGLIPLNRSKQKKN